MSGSGRMPRVLEVPAGAQAVDALWDPLDRALRGVEPIAPIPVASATMPAALVDSMLHAIRPTEPTDEGTALIVTTSGSTGRPRGVQISASAADHLTGQVNARAGADPSWVLAIPATSIGGLNVLIRARGTGRAPIAVRSLGGAERFTDEVFAEAVEVAGRSGSSVAVSLVPAQLPRLLGSDIGRAALQHCSLILVGGAALASQAARDCADAGISITTTYGMTETSGGCILDGIPLEGVEVRIGSPGSSDDRIFLSGPMLASGYRDGGNESFVDGWLRTNDRGRWSGGRLEVLGRLDDIVTVRGVNVDVVAVEDRLRDHPSVIDAVVVATPDGDIDTRLHAMVVAERDVPAEDVRAWVVDRLGTQAAPASVTRVESLHITSTGKIDRIATARAAGLEPERTDSPGGDLL